jgi:CheY-like chemotaxis protein
MGIAPEDHERVFEEFTQIDSPIQRRVRGTGLGLPLTRRLAELLGGRVELRSALGTGSTFTAVIPRIYVGAAERSDAEWQVPEIEPGRVGVLIVEDNPETALTYEKFLRGTPFQALRAPSLEAARRLLAKHKPAAIVLDVLLEGENTWDLLAELKTEEATRFTPIIVATVVDNRRKAIALGADTFVMKPLDRATLLGELERLTATERQEIVVVDDDDVSRYLLRGYMAALPYRLVEYDNGLDGLRAVRERRPAAVFLDLGLPDMDGLDVLAGIRADPMTRGVPVVVYTSRPFTPSDRASLEESATVVLGKDATSRDAGVRAVRGALERLGVLPSGAPV